MHRGYIKLWRKSFDSGLHRDHKTWALWTYILCNVTYREIDININGETIHLIPGQMITGRKKLSKELHISERGIRTRLNHLKNYGNLTIKTTNRYSIINVINWNTYQQDEKLNDQPNDQQVTSKRPASDHKQEVKNVKEVKNIYKFSKKVPLPSNFIITNEMKKYALEKGSNGNLENLTEDFCIHHRQKGNKFNDWYAAWQKWIRNDLKWNPPTHSNILTPEQLRALNE